MLRTIVAILSMFIFSIAGYAQAKEASVLVIKAPAIVIYFTPEKELQKPTGDDDSEALNDFAVYADKIEKAFNESYPNITVIRTPAKKITFYGTKITPFQRVKAKEQFGFILFAPGEKPEYLHGVTLMVI